MKVAEVKAILGLPPALYRDSHACLIWEYRVYHGPLEKEPHLFFVVFDRDSNRATFTLHAHGKEWSV